MIKRMQEIKGVIFDLDGTLVESRLDFALLKSLVGCPEGVDILGHIESITDAAVKLDAMRIVQTHELQDAESAAWLPGARNLVAQLAKRNLPMAIVTRNFSEAAQIKITRNNIPISLIICREDAPPKPDPTALQMIARRWQLPANRIVYIGDFLYDIQAAKRADMLACLYAPDSLPPYADQADFVCQHFDDLVSALG
jgi:HAD superfamily hydrolase (TIGR01549 family)